LLKQTQQSDVQTVVAASWTLTTPPDVEDLKSLKQYFAPATLVWMG
jgi:hypothetical protein